MKTRDDILRSVTDAVRLVQDASGRAQVDLSERTDLLGDVDGFDSLNALEVIVQVGEDLGLELPDDLLSPRKRDRTLTVGTLVDRIAAFA